MTLGSRFLRTVTLCVDGSLPMFAFRSRRVEPVRQPNRRYITSLHVTDSVLATDSGTLGFPPRCNVVLRTITNFRVLALHPANTSEFKQIEPFDLTEPQTSANERTRAD